MFKCCLTGVMALFLTMVEATAGADEIRKLGGRFERYVNEHQFAFNLFEELNIRSIAINREFCGYMYYDSFGDLKATPPVKGGTHSCLPNLPRGRVQIFASYHTHAAYASDSLNEYPSDQDIRGDFSSQQNGYVATPGGRLWFVDYDKQVARQLCGYRCLPDDPRYREDPREFTKQSVNLRNIQDILEQRFGGAGD